MGFTRREFVKKAGLWVPAAGLALRTGFGQPRIPGPGGAAPAAGISPIAFVTHSSGNNPTDFSTAVTAGVDTTTATLLVLMIANYATATDTATVTDTCTIAAVPDSATGNVWHSLPTHFNSIAYGGLWYAWDHGGSPLVVGAGHKVSFSGRYPVGQMAAFKFTKVASTPFEAEVGGNTGADTLTLPSQTPSQNGELQITGISVYPSGGSTAAIDSGFTFIGTVIGAGVAFYNSLAYLIQTTAVAKAPIWSGYTGPLYAGSMAAFKGQ